VTAGGANLRFRKMHGLGNDFVIIDSRHRKPKVTEAMAKALGNRNCGVGFDQLAEVFGGGSQPLRLKFFNADGSLSAACGNATRCVAWMLMNELGADSVELHSDRGLLQCLRLGDGRVSVNMGVPLLDWRQIPLAYEAETLELPIAGNPAAVGMGNPHCVFVVNDPEVTNVEDLGPKFERHPIFPERSNVEFVAALSRQRIRMRIWERGVGITRASGSGACASTVACARLGLVDKRVEVVADGGTLEVDWTDQGVWLSGPTTHVFDGELTTGFSSEING